MAKAMQPSEKITQLASLYQKSQILLVANNAEVFDLLTEPTHPEAVADALQWDNRGTRLLLDGLVAIGFVEHTSQGYNNLPIATQHLCSDSPDPLRAFLRHTVHCKARWDHLEESLRLGHGLKVGHHILDTQEFRDYVDAMEELGNLTMGDVLTAVDFSPYRNMLDLGCGAGQCSRAILEAHLQVQSTLFDLPEVLTISKERIAASSVQERITYRSGDCEQDDLGEGYDLIWVSNLFHGLSAEASAALFQKCYAALIPGGTLMVKDFIVDNDGAGPPFSRIFGLHMYLHTYGGNTWKLEDYTRWAKDAGFASPHIQEPGRSSRILIMKKPD